MDLYTNIQPNASCMEHVHRIYHEKYADCKYMIQGASGQIYFTLWSRTGTLSHNVLTYVIQFTMVIFWVSLTVRHVEDYETLKGPNP